MKAVMTFIKDQPVRFFALICVAVTSGFIMYMSSKLTDIMTSPGWCNRTLNADKIVGPKSDFDALQACIGLLQIQLKATATNWHIYAGTLALCLLTLIVIVVAGGHLSFTSPLGNANMGSDAVSPAAKAATETAAAAVDKAVEITSSEAPSAQLAPGEDG